MLARSFRAQGSATFEQNSRRSLTKSTGMRFISSPSEILQTPAEKELVCRVFTAGTTDETLSGSVRLKGRCQ
jgi:hypothetical protein